MKHCIKGMQCWPCFLFQNASFWRSAIYSMHGSDKPDQGLNKYIRAGMKHIYHNVIHILSFYHRWQQGTCTGNELITHAWFSTSIHTSMICYIYNAGVTMNHSSSVGNVNPTVPSILNFEQSQLHCKRSSQVLPAPYGTWGGTYLHSHNPGHRFMKTVKATVEG